MPATPTPFPRLVDAFLFDLGTRKPSKHTTAAYRRDLFGVAGRLAEAAGVSVEALTLEDLSKSAVRQAFSSWATDHAAASVRRAWSAWNGLFGFLVAEDVVEGNPMAAIKAPKLPRGQAKVIHGDQVVDRLLATAAVPDPRARHPWPERDLALLATYAATGMRLSEVLSLTVASIQGPDGERRLAVKGKGGAARTIPVELAWEQLLSSYMATRAARFPRHRLGQPTTPLFVRADTGTVLGRQQVEYLVDRLYRRAGVRAQIPAGALVHALRHSFATAALDHGTDVVELQELLGHASLDTTRRYLEATGAQLRTAVRAHPAQRALRQAASGHGAD